MTHRWPSTDCGAGTLTFVSSSTLENPAVNTARAYRSWGRAFADLSAAWKQRTLWGHLGWQDIKQGYRRSVLGPLWITISTGVMALAMGILFSAIQNQPIEFFLPYVTVGLVCWTFINNCINEGAHVFIANEGLIKQLPSPLTTHIFRLVWRQVLLFAHNFLIYFIMLAIFPQELKWTAFYAIPAFLLIVLNGGWVSLAVGIVSTRFRDIPPIIGSITMLLFYLTPIVWDFGVLKNHPNPVVSERAYLAEFNPFLHFIEIIRRPLLGQDQLFHHWLIVGIITLVGWAAALVLLRNYRARVSYWV